MTGIRLSKLSIIFILIAILVLSFTLRYSVAQQKNGYSFGDGGRDLFVIKHVADGSAPFNITPPSSSKLIPNTLIYYQMLGLFYRIGGLDFVLLMFVLSGVLVVFCTYLIIDLLFKFHWLSLWSAFLVGISPFFINLSSNIWQPNIQFPFAIASFCLVLTALSTHKIKYFYLSLIPFFLTLSLHNTGLPIVTLFSLFLVFDLRRNGLSAEKKYQNIFLVLLCVMWLSWLGLTYYGNPITLDGSDLFTEASPARLLSAKFVEFVISLFDINHVQDSLPLWIKISSPFLVIVAFIKNYQKKLLPRTITALIVALISFLLLLAIVPGAEYRGWYFYLQTYLLFILIPLMPIIVWQRKKTANLLLAISVFLFSYVAYATFSPPELIFYEPLIESKIVAQVIETDVLNNQIKTSDFSFRIKKSDTEEATENRLQKLSEYFSSSVQFSLESQDFSSSNRPPVVDSSTNLTKWMEADRKISYLFCLGYQIDNQANCVNGIYSEDGVGLEKKLLTVVDLYRPIFIYKVTKL